MLSFPAPSLFRFFYRDTPSKILGIHVYFCCVEVTLIPLTPDILKLNAWRLSLIPFTPPTRSSSSVLISANNCLIYQAG